MPRVLICDKLESSGIELLSKAGIEVVNKPGLKGDDLKSALQAADGCIVRSATRITAVLLAAPGNLKAIARAGVGVDNIDVDAATRAGIVVMNTPAGNSIAAAELTIALMFALIRQIPAADASLKAGKWERSKFMGTQLTGKTLGVIGLGRIGRAVVSRAIGLEMKIVGFDPFIPVDQTATFGFDVVATVDEMLPRCDFLTVHTPLSEQTRNLIDRPQIARLKPGARLINVGRGGIYNEDALAEGLTNGTIAGAALDVFVQEPLSADSKLLKAPNLVVTPHLGASTIEAQDAVAREAAQLLIDFLQHGLVQFAVNGEALKKMKR